MTTKCRTPRRLRGVQRGPTRPSNYAMNIFARCFAGVNPEERDAKL
jgi:hypothetical protein